MKTKSNFYILISTWLILIICISSGVAGSQTVTAIGMATAEHITPAEAQNIALKKARRNAVEQVSGIMIQSESQVENFVLKSDFIHSISHGQIIGEKIIEWEGILTQLSKIEPPQITYKVTIEAEVKKVIGRTDPDYKVFCWLNKKIFRSGDEMIIRLKVTKPSYISVLNFCADDTVVLLYPNRIRKQNFIDADKEVQFPSEEDLTGILSLKVSNLPGHNQDQEIIKVIATRRPLNLLDELSMQGQYGVMPNLKTAASEIVRVVASIPLHERSSADVSYKIISQ